MKLVKSVCEAWQEEYANRAEIDMGMATVAPLSMKELLDMCDEDTKREVQCADRLPLSYASSMENIELKQEITRLYNCPINNIVTTTGTNLSNMMVFETLLEAEDEVICIMPTHQQLFSIPRAMDITVKYYMVIEYENWKIDIRALEKLCSSHTKMIVINYPNNPLGLSLSEDEMDALIDLCQRYDCYLLNDEVFYGIGSMKSFAGKYEKAIVTGSLSKSFSLPGIRVGWIVANEEVVEKLKIYREYLFLSPGRWDMFMAKTALRHKNQILKRSNDIISKNTAYLKEWLDNEKYFTGFIPNGGTTAFIGYKILDTTSREVSLDLLEKQGVLVIPGLAFGMDDYVRLSVGLSFEEFKEGLHRISNWMKARKG